MSMYELQGMTAAQRQYDNAEPPRYNRRPIYTCDVCGAEIFGGEQCAAVGGTYDKIICCEDCITFFTAGEEQL